MVRINRFFAGMVVLFAVIGAGQTAFAGDDDPKPAKKEEKKLEMPKLPVGSNPKWDFEALQEKFTLVKGGNDENQYVAFLLELKEDMVTTPNYDVSFIDKDGVKFTKTFASCAPATGKKGDRVWLSISGTPSSNKETWVKAVKVQFNAK